MVHAVQSMWMAALLLAPLMVEGVEPNYEDLDLVVDQARDEKVDVTQEDPHSNNIHVAHNNPKNRFHSIIVTIGHKKEMMK